TVTVFFVKLRKQIKMQVTGKDNFMPLIISEVSDNIGSLTLNNPARRNALSLELCRELTAALHDFEARKIPAVIIRAAKNAAVWSAGHDVSELPRSGRDPLAYNDPLEQGVRAVRKFPAPILAMIDASVWGGAVELALSCDILIGTRNATFALTPARLGVPYNPAGILRILSAVGASLIVREMFFTARPLSAERALGVGVLSHLVAPEDIERFTFDMAAEIALLSPLSIQVIKEQIRLLCDATPLSPGTFERIQGLRRRVYDSKDYREGITAFLEKRKPAYAGE
ncbi:MAG: methylmalonyl-CoA decarboxylase, partial [Deltaproteobacteria bacterium]